MLQIHEKITLQISCRVLLRYSPAQHGKPNQLCISWVGSRNVAKDENCTAKTATHI